MRYIFAAFSERVFYGIRQPSATRHFHFDYGDFFDIVIFENICELFGIINRVKLGAANQYRVVFDKPFLKTIAREGGAIGGNQKTSVKTIRLWRRELDLHGPVFQHALFREFICVSGGLAVRYSFPFLKAYRAGGTMRQTVAQPVTIIVTDKSCFAVCYLYRALMACVGTKSATLAFIPVNFYNFSFQFYIP